MKQLILNLAVIFPVLCQTEEFDYLPGKLEGHQIIEYTQFTLSYSEEHEQADWVAYELTKAEAEMKRKRCECFKSDKSVENGSASNADYSSTGFDKGHLAAAADNNMSKKANAESFLMSNMSPQLAALNRGIWTELEDWVREQAILHEKVYVVTGPVFTNSLGKIGSNQVTIPAYFYKVILRFDGENHTQPKTIGFLLPNIAPVGDLKDYVVPVNAIETLTGLDFYPALGRNENQVESQYATGGWGL